MRLSFTGEASFELHHQIDRSVELWQALMHLGQPLGVRPHGLQALFGLRCEKGHILVGQDTELDTHPRRGAQGREGAAGERARIAAHWEAAGQSERARPSLRAAAATFEKFVVEMSKASDALLRQHGKKIADFQYQQKRIADLAIDMFVGLCTLSRADSLVHAKHPAADSAVAICEIFTHQAHRRMSRNVRALTHNEDEQVDKLVGTVLETEKYPFDVI